MNIKRATNSQPSTTEPKKTNKPTTRRGTESQKWKSHGGLSVGKKNGKKGIGIKKHNWQVQNRQRDIKNNIGNGEAKELSMHDSWT